ncbi:MAG: ABC transporter permease [Clostridiales bacterium]|nr:ABC transporter permease [Clostridiales bacterium]
MLSYILRRILMMIPVLIIISIISFTIIELPPGDFMTSYIARLGEDGTGMAEARAEALMARFGVGEAFHIRYWKWVTGFVRGDLGFSFLYNAPVNSVIGERLLLTFLITLGTVIFTWAVAFPIGVYSAIKQYSASDYIFTFIGFLGLAIPNFLLALLFMYISFAHLGWSVGGLFSLEYLHLPWSWGKFVNLLQHLWVPVVVVGTAGTAGMIRILRATLLDELKKAYVTTARERGD